MIKIKLNYFIVLYVIIFQYLINELVEALLDHKLHGHRKFNTLSTTDRPPLRYDMKLEVLSDDEQVLMKELIKSLQIESKRSYLDILTERFAQSIDDIQLNSKIKDFSKIIDKDPIQKESIVSHKREKVVVLGSGWGSYSFLKCFDSTKYEVIVVSPRNYFLFTPMLAASAVGTVEFKSICDPIRNINPFVDYLEATASDVDIENNIVNCEAIKCEGTSCDILDFNIEYDYLIIAVGAKTNTFGIKGVDSNCMFLKQVEDASNVRKAIISCFERANVPGLAEIDIKTALSFVIVGAGPTGVEFTSELRDWIEYEGRKYYSVLLKYVKIFLVEAGDNILPIFDEVLRNEALSQLTGDVYYIIIYVVSLLNACL